MLESAASQLWIVKPAARGEGKGIFVASSLKEINARREEALANNPSRAVKAQWKAMVVQPLLKNPLLVQGRKMDLRCYVLITSVHPLRAYFYRSGLVRLAASEHSSDHGFNHDRSQLLTNTFVGVSASTIFPIAASLSPLSTRA